MAKKPILAKQVSTTCPNCHKEIRIIEVLFTADFTVVVNGKCDQCELLVTSGERPILACLPEKKNGKAS